MKEMVRVNVSQKHLISDIMEHYIKSCTCYDHLTHGDIYIYIDK